MPDSPYVFEIDESNFAQIVLQGSQQLPVLVDFWASWCQPCQMLMPILAKLVDEYGGRFILAKVNTEEQQAIAAQFNIRSIPAVKLFKSGQPIDEFTGALPEAEIRAFLEKHLPRPSDNIVLQAEQQLLSGDIENAMALLTKAHDTDPDNPRIIMAMAQAQAADGDSQAAEKLLDQLPESEQARPEIQQLRAKFHFDGIAAGESADVLVARLRHDPDDSDARYQLAAHHVVRGDVEGAMAELLQLMQKDRAFGDDAARTTLLKIFDMLGDDPIVTRYRARMFTLLH